MTTDGSEFFSFKNNESPLEKKIWSDREGTIERLEEPHQCGYR